ncbi:hypothetical protein GQX74_006679 [Glossina fuscipes]|nr:hypothetical protein GQX74_006679 [Glossina fuscipes]
MIIMAGWMYTKYGTHSTEKERKTDITGSKEVNAGIRNRVKQKASSEVNYALNRISTAFHGTVICKKLALLGALKLVLAIFLLHSLSIGPISLQLLQMFEIVWKDVQM